jgi:hypothetical protein
MKKIELKVFLMMMSFLLCASNAFAVVSADLLKKVEVRVGPARIKPTMRAESSFNSNYDLMSSHAKSSMLYRFTSGLSLQIPLQALYFEASADTMYSMVAKGDHTWSGHGRGIIRYNFSKNTSVGITQDYSKGDLYGTVSGSNFTLYQTEVMLKQQLSPRLALALSGTRDKYDTKVKEGDDKFFKYRDTGGSFDIEEQLSLATTVGITGKYHKRNYPEVKEKAYDSWEGDLKIVQQIMPRLSFGVSGGYTKRNYDVGSPVKAVVYGSTLNYTLSNFSTLGITYTHDLQDTFYPQDKTILNNPFPYDEVNTNLLNENYKYVKNDRCGLNFNYNFTERDSVSLGGEYIISSSGGDLGSLVSKALQAKLKERAYYGGLGYSHRFTSWCSFDIKGTYGVRNSNVRNKYDYYTTSGGLNVSF